MKNQDIFPSEEMQKYFLESVSKLKNIFWGSKLKNIFQDQKNFLEPYAVNVWKNFLAGTEALNKLMVGDLYEKTKEAQGSYEEGGIRIQENSPKSGGREETKTT